MDRGSDTSDGSPTSPSEESEQVDEPKEPLDASELADSAEDQGLDSASDTQESANAESPPNRTGWYLGWFVFSAVGLGILVAWDVIQASAKKSVDLIYNDDGGGTEGYDLYEKAEAAWARGTFIEAIDLLRSYLEINPLQQHAAIRIAEIYEKDLSNYLAAAMEYEEILKQRLARAMGLDGCSSLKPLLRATGPTRKGHRTAQGSGGALSGYGCCHEGG